METEARKQQVAEPALGIEVHSIDWIPERERHGKLWHQAPLWFLGNFQYFTIPLGFIGPAMGLSLWWTAIAGFLGIVVGTLFMAFHGSQGPKLGLPQMIQSRAQFGYRGAVIVLFVVLFTYIGFNVTDQVLLSQGISGAYGWDPTAIAVVTVVAAALLAIFGHDWVHRIFRVLLIISFPLVTVITIAVITGHAGGITPKTHYGFTFTAFMAEFSAAAAYNITYAPCVSDYSRYLPTKTKSRSVIFSVFFGASSSAIWLITLGAWIAIHLNAHDGLLGLKIAGNNVIGDLGSVAALASALALIATMGMSAYGASLTLLTGIDCFKKVTPTRTARIFSVIGLAVVWYLIGDAITTSAANTISTALTLMLYLLVPWTATNLIDYFYVRRGHYAITDLFSLNGIYHRWNWRGITAYAVGFVAEIPFMVLPKLDSFTYIGPIAKLLNDTDFSWLAGLVITSIAYILITRGFDNRSEEQAIIESEATLRTEFG
ncbi:purine-cytosine permease family protein [Ferrimicrobium acidiphilum]|uniref:purine-cytosine permease family protein n=1 Tax=Ferrimicrobium acidiphilum TaxID=121039 RepID=UPI0023F225C1|nr:cytosine permease [Ferrimicrobium acidiphilum]